MGAWGSELGGHDNGAAGAGAATGGLDGDRRGLRPAEVPLELERLLALAPRAQQPYAHGLSVADQPDLVGAVGRRRREPLDQQDGPAARGGLDQDAARPGRLGGR